MSNFLAIATVTATLSQLLESIKVDVPGTQITTKPPDVINSEGPANRLNLVLYQITPNMTYRNEDLPTRNSKGELIKTPQLALDLHYLFTAYGADNDDLMAQQVLASAIRIVHENSIISKEIIRDAIKSRDKLKISNLDEQIEGIKITLQSMSIEEITKLWSSFFQTNYRISVPYQVTVVLLDSSLQPRPALAVKDRMLYVVPMRQPFISKIEPQVVEKNVNAQIIVSGRNLKSVGVKILIDGSLIEPKTEDITNDTISLKIPSGLSAGIKHVQVMHPFVMGMPPTERAQGYQSNLAPFVLAPRVISITPQKVVVGKDMTIKFEPAAEPKQNITVLIGDATLKITPRADGTDPISSIIITVPNNFSTGKSFLRLRIDGAESILQTDDDSSSPTYMKFLENVEVVKS